MFGLTFVTTLVGEWVVSFPVSCLVLPYSVVLVKEDQTMTSVRDQIPLQREVNKDYIFLFLQCHQRYQFIGLHEPLLRLSTLVGDYKVDQTSPPGSYT